jgi:hypothetical protein
MLFWSLTVAGVVAGLAVLAVAIGFLLPKGHTAAGQLRLKADRQAVWDVICDFPGQVAWRPGLEKVERLADRDGHEVWNEVQKNGWGLPLETVESRPPERLVRKIADPKLPFGGTWTYELAEESGETLLTITENGEVHNPVFRLMSRMTDPAATINGYLRDLSRQLGGQ